MEEIYRLCDDKAEHYSTLLEYSLDQLKECLEYAQRIAAVPCEDGEDIADKKAALGKCLKDFLSHESPLQKIVKQGGKTFLPVDTDNRLGMKT